MITLVTSCQFSPCETPAFRNPPLLRTHQAPSVAVGFGRRPYNFRSSLSLLCLFLVSAAKWTQTLAIAANVSRAVASGNV